MTISHVIKRSCSTHSPNLFRFVSLKWLFFHFSPQWVQHYKRDSDGLCHRLVCPYVSSEASKRGHDLVYIEERKRDFEQAGLLLSIDHLRIGSVIGHGEFGGWYFSFKCKIQTPQMPTRCALWHLPRKESRSQNAEKWNSTRFACGSPFYDVCLEIKIDLKQFLVVSTTRDWSLWWVLWLRTRGRAKCTCWRNSWPMGIWWTFSALGADSRLTVPNWSNLQSEFEYSCNKSVQK